MKGKKKSKGDIAPSSSSSAAPSSTPSYRPAELNIDDLIELSDRRAYDGHDNGLPPSPPPLFCLFSYYHYISPFVYYYNISLITSLSLILPPHFLPHLYNSIYLILTMEQTNRRRDDARAEGLSGRSFRLP